MIKTYPLLLSSVRQSNLFGTHKDVPYETELRNRHVLLVYPMEIPLNTLFTDLHVFLSNRVQRTEPSSIEVFQADLISQVPSNIFTRYLMKFFETHFEFGSSMSS